MVTYTQQVGGRGASCEMQIFLSVTIYMQAHRTLLAWPIAGAAQHYVGSLSHRLFELLFCDLCGSALDLPYPNAVLVA